MEMEMLAVALEATLEVCETEAGGGEGGCGSIR